MSYIALARKWRPRTFSQLVGQEHINKALINSLTLQRLHHAYLFSGTRGVGKTSIARLFAKALNCEKGISHEPCLECDACIAIEQGRFIDLIEIDGASRTRVEDTREMLENVQYSPTNARFKIYLIDEVHMLSQHSFNALLKTLEEPPEHVKFLLATTDPQKLPVTVLSRCLQFNLKPINDHVITEHMHAILESESVPHEREALSLLAKAARGSMRDALSLLDQAIASSDNHLYASDIKLILGYTQQDYALQLLQALVELAPEKLLGISQQIAMEGGNVHFVLDELITHLHQISICQSVRLSNPLIKPSDSILELSSKLTPEDTQLFYQIAIKGLEEIHLAPTLAIGFDMTLLRMYTFRPARNEHIPQLAYQKGPAELKEVFIMDPVASNHAHETIFNDAPELQMSKPTINAAVSNEQITIQASNPHASEREWPAIIAQLKLSGLAQTAAENSELISKKDAVFSLRIAKGHQSVFTPTVISRIEKALTLYYKETIKLSLTTDKNLLSTPAQQKKVVAEQQQQDAVATLQNDPFFQELQQTFSAEVVKNSITPLKDDL